MNQRLLSYLSPQTIEIIQSPFNGTITVHLWMGKYSVDVGGLMQSGVFLEETWEKAFKKFEVRNLKFEVKNILILGLGAGSVLVPLAKNFPDARITGVDIDAKMVNAGKKHFGTERFDHVYIVITDCQKFIQTEIGKKNRYNLIIVDIFSGWNTPSQFQTELFLKNVRKLLTKNGVVVFNRLKSKTDTFEAKQFLDKVEKIYNYVYRVNVLANEFLFAKISLAARPLKVT